MKIHRFEDLQIWQDALNTVKAVYEITKRIGFNTDFGLRDQIRRAAVSIPANIAEGFEKSNNNEFIRFLKISKGSAGEVRNHLHIALAVGYIQPSDFAMLSEQLERLSSQIGALIVYLVGKRAAGEFLPTR